MAKLALFVAVLVAIVALSTAEGDNNLNLQTQCQRELQESSLDACQQIVDQQLAVQLPFFHPRSSPFLPFRSSQLGTGVRVQCCQQLRDISGVCRVAAIRQIVRQYEHQICPYYPGEDEKQQGGSYYPGETYTRQEQGWEQGQGWYRPSITHQQQHGQGWYLPSQTHQQQQEQGWYRPIQTHHQQQEEGWYSPSQTHRPQEHQQGSCRPSQTHQQLQEQGWHLPSQTYHPQEHQQGSYRPSQTHQQQQEQGWYLPSQTYHPQQHQKGSYGPSQTSPQQQQQLGGFCSQSTAQQQQQLKGRQEPYGLNILSHAQQPYELGQTTQQQETGSGRCSSPPRSGTDQQTARLRQLQVVARARQVAAQLPAMCRLEGSVFSGGHH